MTLLHRGPRRQFHVRLMHALAPSSSMEVAPPESREHDAQSPSLIRDFMNHPVLTTVQLVLSSFSSARFDSPASSFGSLDVSTDRLSRDEAALARATRGEGFSCGTEMWEPVSAHLPPLHEAGEAPPQETHGDDAWGHFVVFTPPQQQQHDIVDER